MRGITTPIFVLMAFILTGCSQPTHKKCFFDCAEVSLIDNRFNYQTPYPMPKIRMTNKTGDNTIRSFEEVVVKRAFELRPNYYGIILTNKDSIDFRILFLESIAVEKGQLLNPGDKIGTVRDDYITINAIKNETSMFPHRFFDCECEE